MGAETIFQDIIAKNFPNLGKEAASLVKKAVSILTNPKRTAPIHIIVKNGKNYR